MRTTLAVDDDVALRLADLQKKEAKSFKAVINETLRKGLIVEESSQERQIFQTPSLALGACRYAGVDRVSELLAVAEGENRL